jgi:biotin transporter BioY
VATDVLAVLVFAAIGTVVHHGVSGWREFTDTAWPFLVGLFLGWGALSTLHLHPRARVASVFPIVGTVVFGLLLRALGQGGRTTLSYMVVTVVLVTVLLLGWRWLDLMVRRRRRVGPRA